MLEVECKIDENSVAETLAVDTSQAKQIHLWGEEPAKEPVYPPGTYRGMY